MSSSDSSDDDDDGMEPTEDQRRQVADRPHPLGRMPRELIAAYERGESRLELLIEARYLRQIAGAGQNLPQPLLERLMRSRDTNQPFLIYRTIGGGMPVDPSSLWFELTSSGSNGVAMLVLDESYILIHAEDPDEHDPYLNLLECARTPELDASIQAFVRSTGGHPLHAVADPEAPRQISEVSTKDWAQNCAVRYSERLLDDELAALFMRDILRFLKGREVLTYGMWCDADLDPQDVRSLFLHDDTPRHRRLISFLLHKLSIHALWQRTLPPPGARRRRRNWFARGPHVLRRALVEKNRATTGQRRKRTRRFKDACFTRFVYETSPKPMFMLIVSYL